MPTVDKSTDLQEAAVAVVLEAAAAALADNRNEYIETYAITTRLRDLGLVDDWTAETGWTAEEAKRKSAEGRVRRVLDKEVARGAESRILRLSSREHDLLPRLDGRRRGLYGNAVAFTTPEVFEKAEKMCAEADAQARADQEHMDALLRVADDLGLPKPRSSNADSVTFEREDFRALLTRIGPVE